MKNIELFYDNKSKQFFLLQHCGVLMTVNEYGTEVFRGKLINLAGQYAFPSVNPDVVDYFDLKIDPETGALTKDQAFQLLCEYTLLKAGGGDNLT